jgi:hypothetical protein
MSFVHFDASVVEGKIEIPFGLLSQIPNQVHVTLSPVSKTRDPNAPSILKIIASGELRTPGFQPLTREEAHER